MPRNVVVTGLGFITCIGINRADVVSRLREGRTGVVAHDFCGNPRHPVRVAAPVPGFKLASPSWREWEWPACYEIPRETVRGLSPHGVSAFCAVEQALADSRLTPGDITGEETGLFCASAGSALLMHYHISELENSNYERGHPMAVVSSISGTLNFNLAAHYHITGAVAGFVSACTSSSHALGYAFDEIMLGRQDRMIVVGAEDLNAETDLPFAAMRALSTNPDPLTASRPFDVHRDGFVPTGGAVAMILEEENVAKARGAPIHARMLNWGQAADGYSIATSHPEGAGLQRAIRRALAAAGLSADQVDYVNAHATSTPAGDRSEALALQAFFRNGTTLISSTKGLTGHGLSMAGVMEAGFAILAMNEGFAPGNAALTQPDAACDGLQLPRQAVAADLRVVMNNSSGFGGSNVSHLFCKP